ncbi:sigma-54-dependent Fis family transcriptional regulator, partial [Candidatus Poribacteria bacterium]|nr:sigma-54-dependent Fis family transcriptional regulator [Candidatus Poribacteria bacterium]
APSDLSVILVGETGSGKEVLAETIHKKSLRKGKFVTINCGGLDDNLIQDTFFGHVKGAFNNAYSSRIGAFEEAEGGTLFLDEINNLSLNTQEKLLRVLDGKKFRKIGSNIDIEPKFRIISATNQDLKKLITNGKFKEDLYYRLAGQVFKIPPIRERKEDIIPLLEYFLEREGSSINKISEDAKILMLSYNWPGNVRQLHSCIKSAAFFAKGREIQPQHIIAAEESLQHVIPFDKPILNIKQIERDNIINVLKSKGWNIAESAEILKISRQTLYNKIKKDEYLKSEFEDARVKV